MKRILTQTEINCMKASRKTSNPKTWKFRGQNLRFNIQDKDHITTPAMQLLLFTLHKKFSSFSKICVIKGDEINSIVVDLNL